MSDMAALLTMVGLAMAGYFVGRGLNALGELLGGGLRVLAEAVKSSK